MPDPIDDNLRAPKPSEAPSTASIRRPENNSIRMISTLIRRI